MEVELAALNYKLAKIAVASLLPKLGRAEEISNFIRLGNLAEAVCHFAYFPSGFTDSDRGCFRVGIFRRKAIINITE